MSSALAGKLNVSKKCNPLLIKKLRESRGMTQLELAKEAGYSVRLVAKAEAGHPLAFSTVADLAAALSTESQKITPDDLVCDPVSLAMKYIEALYVHQRKMIPQIRYFLDDDIVFDICGDPSIIPFAGTHHGYENVDAAIQRFFDVLEVPPNYDHRPNYHYVSNGVDVIVWGKSWIHPIGRPLEQPMPISNLFRFRDGKLYHFEDNYDTQMAERILMPAAVNLSVDTVSSLP